MKKLLKRLNFILIFCTTCIGLSAQTFYTGECIFPASIDTFTNPGKTDLYSKNGYLLPTSGTIRVLVVFAEVNYDTGIDPNPNSTSGWSVHSLPTWANQIFDYNIPTGNAQGTVTRYFQLASSGNYNVLGDYLLAPTNGGIFSVPNSQISSIYDHAALCNIINTTMSGTFVTGHNLNNATYFDNWSIAQEGLPKTTPSTDSPHKYDHVMIIWRNRFGGNMCGYGTAAPGGSPGAILGYNSDTYTDILTYGDNPTNVVRHEYSHMIYGGNNFHCGGGGWGVSPPEDYWIPQEGGWSNMGLYGCSLWSWNAWDRQRLSWNAPGNTYNPSARNSGNTAEVNGELDATNPSQAGTYTLRDFVTTGDALKIKLPFTNGTAEYPEYIWIENHNGISMNGCQYDQWQYQNASCVQPASYGLYMYMQIDKDIRQSIYSSDIYGGYAAYLRPITAEGFYDRSFETTTIYNSCVQGGNTNAFIKIDQNPLTGGGDQDLYTVDLNVDGTIDHSDQMLNFVEKQNGTYAYNLFSLGNTRQVFTYSGNNKLGVGTNPSSSTMMNMVSYNSALAGAKNIRKVYLNGVSIQILNQNSNGNIQVQIRFDDVDVNNDVRWCADEIVLDPVSTTSGYSLNLKTSHTITLDQGTTATRMNNPQTISGQEVFASPTLFRCTASTWFNMETNSNIILNNLSTLILESGSTFTINDGSKLVVKQGCSLIIKSGADLNIYNSGNIEIENGGYICIENGANINLSDFLSVINLRPGYISGINPSIGITASCTSDPSSYTVTGNGAINTFTSDNFIQNITISTNKYYNGNNVSGGYDVTTLLPFGNVIIQSPAHVIIDATNEILLKNSIEIQCGSIFEMK